MNAMKKQVQEMEASIKSHKEEMNRRMTSIEKKISTLRTENSIPLTTESTEEDKITFAEQIQTIEKSNEDRTRRIVELESAVKQLQEKENRRKNQVKLRLFAFLFEDYSSNQFILNKRYHPKKENSTESKKDPTISFQKSRSLAFQASSAPNVLLSRFSGPSLF
jgi:septal ring factor EnvC (AmiA/AmiB activator)